MHTSSLRASAILSRLGENPRGAEIGVFKGSLSRRLLVRKDLNLLMVDSWGGYEDRYGKSGDRLADQSEKEQENNLQTAIAITDFAEERRTIIRNDSVKAAEDVEDESLDFVFIDADHSYEGCRKDIESWFPKLKPGGLLCGHDYDHPDFPDWGVKQAVHEFSSFCGLSVETDEDYTWFVRMPGKMENPSIHYNRVQFCCVKWGTKYNSAYVNVLADMVERNCSLAADFICFTDDPTGLNEGIDVRELPGGLEGWWNKIYLFKPDLFPPKTRVVFLDLDVVVTGRLEPLIDRKGIATDWQQGGYNSSVMVWDSGEYEGIWNNFNPEIAKKMFGDQDWITTFGGWDEFPVGWIASYKIHSMKWPPTGSIIVAFHGDPKPHEINEGWVPEMWTMDGLAQPKFYSVLNNEIDAVKGNITQNKSNDIEPIIPGEKIPESICFVGGGPSLKESLFDIQLCRAKGDKIWALNGAHDWLIEHGIIPDAMVLLDSRKESLTFLNNPHNDVIYYIATQCDPEAFEILKGYTVRKWTAWGWGVEDDVVIGGGATVGMKSICMAFALGYRNYKLFGYDSSYRGEDNHAWKQPLNDDEEIIEIIVRGQKFKSAKWMARQVREFQDMSREMIGRGCTFEVFGEGLLQQVCKLTEGKENGYSITAS